MGATNMMVSVLEQCRISPPPGAVADTSLPLTFFDIKWLMIPPVHRLLFYGLPNSKTDFIQTLVPNLKNSLSLALKHYFPFAGNSIIPSTSLSSSSPQIRYLNGDSVSLTVAECTSKDFNHLAGNHARDVNELFPLVPQLPPGTSVGGCVVSPLFAVQVTFFPNHGTTVGFTISHVAADGKSMCNFIRAWASIAKQLCSTGDNKDEASSILFPVPFYDRSVIKDPKGITNILWSHYLKIKIKQQENFQPQPQPAAAPQLVQATIVMYRADIQDLKNLVLTKLPTLAHVSSFTVVCAYLWSCMAKARVAIGQEVRDENEEENFVFVMDCRARLDPPLPDTYFGNCLVGCSATRKSAELVGEEGILAAAEGIGEAIHTKLNNEEGGVLKSAELWYAGFETITTQKAFMIAGSPKFDYYSTDFGWGKPKKLEVVSQKCSLNSEGDVEIGVCFTKNLVEAFTNIFAKGLVKVKP